MYDVVDGYKTLSLVERHSRNEKTKAEGEGEK
jgi:hypothetical protein